MVADVAGCGDGGGGSIGGRSRCGCGGGFVTQRHEILIQRSEKVIPRDGRTIAFVEGGVKVGRRRAIGLEHVVDEFGGVGGIGETAQHPDVRDENGRVKKLAAGAHEFVKGDLALRGSDGSGGRGGGSARVEGRVETSSGDGDEEGGEGRGEIQIGTWG